MTCLLARYPQDGHAKNIAVISGLTLLCSFRAGYTFPVHQALIYQQHSDIYKLLFTSRSGAILQTFLESSGKQLK